MFDKLNKAVSKVLSGSKTNLNTGLLGMLSMWLATKGVDLGELQIWVQSLIGVLTGAGVYFRQLKGLIPTKKGKK